jgi:hypothetical protein
MNIGTLTQNPFATSTFADRSPTHLGRAQTKQGADDPLAHPSIRLLASFSNSGLRIVRSTSGHPRPAETLRELRHLAANRIQRHRCTKSQAIPYTSELHGVMLRSFATRPQKAKRRQVFDLTALIWLRGNELGSNILNGTKRRSLDQPLNSSVAKRP